MEPAAVRPEASDFWTEVASTPGGESIATCILCNECTSMCPVGALEPNLSVRRTIAGVKRGLREDVLSDPAIWVCTRCFACDASCPKGARPGEILEALRHLSLKVGAQGPGPRHTLAFVQSIRANGRIHETRVTSLRPHRLKSVSEVKRIIDAAEGSQ